MLILATDTSGKHGSVALGRCEADTTATIELVPLQGGTFSAQLIPQVAELLSRHNLSKSDLDAFAVVTGPGSFTGLRVGLAAIKALAEILEKPIAAVSLLEVIAFEAGEQERAPNYTLLAAMDAGRNEAFVGEYKFGSELPSCVSESLLSLSELASRMTDSPTPIYSPDDSVVQFLSSRDVNSGLLNLVQRPDAISVASLGWKKLNAHQTLSPEALDATYIRRADAEIANPNRPA